jgi:hypothetical protein
MAPLPDPPYSSSEPPVLEYRHTPKALPAIWPKLGRKTVAAMLLYGLFLITPTYVRGGDWVMGWEMLALSMGAIFRGHRCEMTVALANLAFALAVACKVLAVVRPGRAIVAAGDLLASAAAMLAVPVVLLLGLMVAVGNAWGGTQSIPSIGCILWPAALLTLGLRLRRRPSIPQRRVDARLQDQ